MIKPKCTCGAYAVGSVVHTDACEVTVYERDGHVGEMAAEDLQRMIQAGLEQFVGSSSYETVREVVTKILTAQLENMKLLTEIVFPDQTGWTVKVSDEPVDLKERLAPTVTFIGPHVCQWVEYEGITRRYEYCRLCDRKRGGNA